LIDVRTPVEAEFGVIHNAILIDYYSPQFINDISALDKSKPVVFYCASGIRSEKAATKLLDMGFSEIYDLQGGIRGWQSAGNSIDKPDE
jgi:rhodanese-related sulfurtransferase